ncbi:MAG: Tm-1-like ATP-binding domain-containing protein [Verrucomicrobia bacterium]|nr:Tm-1-like ATP-binding domain-containing protein [Verrucomicrobiota bacterium]
MNGKIVIIGTLDTKGADFGFVRDLMREAGVETLTIDVGTIGEPAFTPEVTRAEVAAAAGVDLADFRSGEHKDRAMQAMTNGVVEVVRRLQREGQVAGVFSMGGSGGTAIATAAMRALPVGLPKVMVSTVGGGDVSAYVGGKDIIFFPSIVDVAGLNRISKLIYANAAHAMIGMARVRPPSAGEDKPLLAASMFGSTTPCVTAVKEAIEQHGFEVLVFHATGTGGRTMEALIEQGLIAGLLDITTTELADNVCGGVMDAGPERCLAAPRAGLPTVLVPGCVDMVNFWSVASVPGTYQQRQLYRWNPNVTLMRTNVEENREIGRRIAAAANAATGPVAILIPKRGVSLLDREGGDFWKPEADQACFDAIRTGVRSGIPVLQLDHHINDPPFTAAVASQMLQLLQQRGPALSERQP